MIDNQGMGIKEIFTTKKAKLAFSLLGLVCFSFIELSPAEAAAPQKSKNAEGKKGTIMPPKTTVSGTPSLKKSADQNSSNNNIGSIMASTASSALSMVAGYFMTESFTSCPDPAKAADCAFDVGMTALFFGMSAAAQFQSQAHGKTARESAQVGSYARGGGFGESSSDYGSTGDTPGGGDPPGSPTPDHPTTPSTDYTNPQLAEIAAKINSGAIPGLSNADLKHGTIKIDGKTIGVNDLNSPQAMMDAGISPSVAKSAWDEAQKISDDIAKKFGEEMTTKMGAQTEALGLDEGGGSGGDYSRDRTSREGGFSAKGFGGSGGRVNDGAERSLAGLQKKLNGEPIGVAADSIFNMMSRRYKVKERENSFFDERELNFKN